MSDFNPGTNDGLWAGDPSTELVDLETGELDRAVRETQILAAWARQVIRSGSISTESWAADERVLLRGSYHTSIDTETHQVLQRVHNEEMQKIFRAVGGVV